MRDFRSYMFNYYYVVMQYGFGDVYPRNPIEHIGVGITLICSLMVSNFYVSEIAGLVYTTSAKQTAFQEKLDHTNMVMYDVIELDEENSNAIREYFFKTQYNKDLQEQFDGFLTSISPTL